MEKDSRLLTEEAAETKTSQQGGRVPQGCASEPLLLSLRLIPQLPGRGVA